MTFNAGLDSAEDVVVTERTGGFLPRRSSGALFGAGDPLVPNETRSPTNRTPCGACTASGLVI